MSRGKVVLSCQVPFGAFFSFWDANVRKASQTFNSETPEAKKLLNSMSAKLEKVAGQDVYHGGGWDVSRGGIQVEVITTEQRERAWAMIQAEREALMDAMKDTSKRVSAAAHLDASIRRWGDDPSQIKYSVVTGNRRSHCLTLALAQTLVQAKEHGLTADQAAAAFQSMVPVTVMEYANEADRVEDQLRENTGKTEGFYQLTWQDVWLTVADMIKNGRLTNSALRDMWPGGTTITQRIWHLNVINNVYPQLNLYPRLSKKPGLDVDEILEWPKMNHSMLPSISAACTYEGIKKWSEREKSTPLTKIGPNGDPVKITEPLTAAEVDNILREMSSGKKVERMPKTGVDALASSANPFVRAAVQAVTTNDRSGLDRLDRVSESANYVGQIYLAKPELAGPLEAMLKQILLNVNKVSATTLDDFAALVALLRPTVEARVESLIQAATAVDLVPVEGLVYETPKTVPEDEHAADVAATKKSRKK